MLKIETGANWWVDQVARFSGGDINVPFKSGAINEPKFAEQNPLDLSSDSTSSVISDNEEEGEAVPVHQETESHGSPVDLVADTIDTHSTDMGVSEEIVTAAAKHLGVIEAAMRQHRASGVVNFDDDDARSGDESPKDSYSSSMLKQMQQNTSQAFSAVVPGKDRAGLLALLRN